MNVDLFDFDLPEAQIALRPQTPREQAKLLHVDKKGLLHDYHIADLPRLIEPGDALVFNDTRVIASALCGLRQRNSHPEVPIHINLHQRTTAQSWRAFARPAKRLREGDDILFAKLVATVVAKYEGGEVELAFNQSGEALDRSIAAIGQMPLPPYIASKRLQDRQDIDDYQTIFARETGAVAAPTAGLHFTETMLDALKECGIKTHFVTLHVGAGTFLPVKVAHTQDHKMHFESGHIDALTAQSLNDIKARGGRIIAVGTTALRLLESAAHPQGCIEAWNGATDIFITPGYQFRACDRLLTNFHLPRSTLFMLVSAFSGLETMQRAYAHAISHHYRFYSYGDACLLDLNLHSDREMPVVAVP